MRRTALLAGVVLGLWAACSAEAQSTRPVPRVGYLATQDATTSRQNVEAFRRGLSEAGFVEGRDIVIEYRWAAGSREQLMNQASDLARRGVDVIFAPGPAARESARRATTTIPIVMVASADPVTEGYVASLSRPGGNITGLTATYPELIGKQLQVLKEIVPGLARVTTLWDQETFGSITDRARTRFIHPMEALAWDLGLQLRVVEVQGPDDIERAVQAASESRSGALRVGETEMLRHHRARVAAAAFRRRLPVVGQFPESAEAGYLLTYGVDLADLHRRAAAYVVKILRGAKAGDLPIERPVKLELLVNRGTATRLGMTLPPAVLARADRVID